MNEKIKIILENGLVIKAKSFGKRQDVIADFIFNTAINGYQEVLSDPSYHQEIVIMTFPVQGIYGINQQDNESNQLAPAGFVVSSFVENFSNNHAHTDLNQYLIKRGVQGVYDVDTRYLTKIIRKSGSLKGAIVAEAADSKTWLTKIKQAKLKNHVAMVSPTKIKILNSQGAKTIVFYDLGAKKSIMNNFIKRNYKIILVPFDTKYQDLKQYQPDYVFFSNGPGDPRELKPLIQEIKKMIQDQIKLFGICLGHQLIALALGCQIKRLKFGHHAINHPVQDLETKKVYITSQNHNYAIDEATLPPAVIPFMQSLHDQTIEGFKHQNAKIIAVQFHPEAAPGPSDAQAIFDQFFTYLGSQHA